MAQVRAQCNRCGVVEVACAAVTVVRRSWEEAAEYNLACPHCADLVRGKVRPDTALQLVSEGARMLDVDGPCARPLTLDEIEAFRSALDEPGVLERELASLRG